MTKIWTEWDFQQFVGVFCWSNHVMDTQFLYYICSNLQYIPHFCTTSFFLLLISWHSRSAHCLDSLKSLIILAWQICFSGSLLHIWFHKVKKTAIMRYIPWNICPCTYMLVLSLFTILTVCLFCPTVIWYQLGLEVHKVQFAHIY